MSTEEWRPVLGYEGLYEVSSLGRVRSVRVRILRPDINSWGYDQYLLYPAEKGKGRRAAGHSIVAEAFHGPRPPGYVVNHKNGKKADNRPENLEWVTPSENVLHAFANGLRQNKGQQHGRAKLTAEAVAGIRATDIHPRGAAAALAHQLGVAVVTVRRIHRGAIWKDGFDASSQMRYHASGHGRPRLTAAHVRAIRRTPNGSRKDVTIRLATRFGVSPITIGKVFRRTTWKDLK